HIHACLACQEVLAQIADAAGRSSAVRAPQGRPQPSDVLTQDVSDRLPPPPPVKRARASSAPPAIAGYDVLGELGRGGWGVVYRAGAPNLNRLVALRRLKAEAASPGCLARFRTEAEALARLQHPHIVQVHGCEGSAAQAVLVLEYVPGGSLEQ